MEYINKLRDKVNVLNKLEESTVGKESNCDYDS